ncbi:YhbD family protein [Effusibacillus lacus]|uniref:DUF4004 domain-containing protein n=1 Tax=Effusibacillus lacus TaxID=1348429 RepID=A0A292YKX7_9BACL|nr:YhbD family protein [Effusibacillus lacus]TCS70790.1 uncharacterized protein DUF4004 [Effusibacillus lacus]GAX89413.1 hypothetical protein EFBL_1031 [Effusibacillus lacus]
MDQNLISKKELLELTGISYGQLYRWKRKNLIPEDWFIRKSTFTGQETFFPKAKILDRIDKILNMKEGLSLNELADMFSPNPAEASLTKDELLKRNIVSKEVLAMYEKYQGETEVFDFEQLLYVYILEKMLQTGEISLDETKIIVQALADHYPKFHGKNCDLIFVRKLGVAICCMVSSPSEVYFESGAKLVAQFNLANCIEELKLKLA